MSFKNNQNWPVCHRCEQREQERRGERHDDIKFEHWVWFSALFALIVIAPAIVEFLA